MGLLITLSISGNTQPGINYKNQFPSKVLNYEHIRISELCQTPGKNALILYHIGDFSSTRPTIFVAANLEGNKPETTDAAYWLIDYLAKNPSMAEKVNWYILPCGNPDAHNRYFSKPQWESKGNNTPRNADNDESTDEDGPDDLNNDGLITQMLVEHPLGEYLKDPKDARLVRKANPFLGEVGKYKLYTEGTDTDKDGQWNEDAPGGVNINRNFSYQFEPFTTENGKWPGSEAESYAIMKFFADHPEIVMVYVFGETDNLLNIPTETQTEAKAKEMLKIPAYMANNYGLDPQKNYSVEELSQLIDENIEDKAAAKRMKKTIMNQKQPTSIQPDDLRLYASFGKQYRHYMKEKGDTNSYLLSNRWENGSFEQFAYYQRGLPVLSMNVFPYLIKKENKEGKEAKEPTTEEKAKIFIAYADSNNLEVFVPWKKIEHPDFPIGVEVGGLKPYATTIPILDSIQTQCEKRIPFLLNLTEQMTSLHLSANLKESNSGIATMEVFVTNKGALPYPISMGERNEKPAPLVLICDTELELLSGRKRTPVGKINPFETKQFTYIVSQNAKKATCTFWMESKNIQTLNQPAKISID